MKLKNSIEITGLCKDYENFSLQEINFVVPQGYVMGLIGENGAGKTTIIKSILHMVIPTKGTVKIFGKDFKKHPKLKEDIGVVMDMPFFVDDWTGKEVEKAISPFYQNWDHHHYQNLCKYLKIPMDKKVKELSRGTKMKLMLAVALSHKAKFLILDEATNGLDPAVKEEMLEYLRQFMLHEDHSILLSSHLTGDLEKLADYITYVRNGKIYYSGAKDELLDSYKLIKGKDEKEIFLIKEKLIGYRENNTGFSALISTNDVEDLPKEVLIQPVTLEDIMVYHNQRRDIYEWA